MIGVKGDDEMKILGYCILKGKKYVMFEDKSCGVGEFKLTDGFHDKIMKWNSEKTKGVKPVSKEEVELKRIVKRMRGSRPWHPLLQILREEVKTE